jgi:hypothetical protein
MRQGMCLKYISCIRKFTGIFYLQFTSEIVPLSHAFGVQSHTVLEIFRKKSVLKVLSSEMDSAQIRLIP